jgi:hypothetical protein
MFWATSIFQAVMILVSFSAFRETYSPFILRRRAERLRRESGNQQYYTTDERLQSDQSIFAVLARALIRPLRLLAFHPIIQLTGLISAFYYGILYIVLSTFSDLWVKQYNESVEISGLHYIACALGEIAGSQIGARLMDFMFRRLKTRTGREHLPEFRIPLIIPGALLGPIGLFIYGWSAQYHLHWAVVDLGILITLLGMQINGMPLQVYVIEAYSEHTSSAAAASQFLRSLTAFSFPLFAPRMYQVLGYGWANSRIAFIGLVVGIPAPLALWVFGKRLRENARPIN